MDFITARRVGTTYGRSTKRVLVHDLFAHRNGIDDSQLDTRSSRDSHSAGSVDGTHNYKNLAPVQEVTQQRNGSRSSSSSLSNHDVVAPSSVLDTSNVKAKTHDAEGDVFAVRSSEDEGAGTKTILKSRKRQKLVQTLPASRADSSTVHGSELTSKSGVKKSRNEITIPKTQAKSGIRNVKSSLASSSYVPSDTDAGETAKATPAANKSLRLKVDRLPQPFHKQPIVKRESIMNESATVTEVRSDDRTSANPMTYSSPSSIDAASATPKRKRTPPATTNTGTPSPNRIGLTSLTFTPEGSRASSRRSTPDLAVDSDRIHRARPRLIDRLDAPTRSKPASTGGQRAHAEKLGAENGAGNLHHASPDRGRSTIAESANKHKSQPDSVSERSQESQTRVTYATKARTTYAKERSHLSDMADSLNMLNDVSSQQSQHGFGLKTGGSNLASQLGFDEDDDDEHVGARPLKSIHELRQAGAMNRFDREIQGMFEDIEAIQVKKRSLRIQALIKLAKRLQDQAFTRHFVSSGRVVRLIAYSDRISNMFEIVPYTVALYVLSKTATSNEIAVQILQAVIELAPTLLAVSGHLGDLLTQKTRDVSKNEAKELLDFEQIIIQQKMLPTYDVSRIYPDGLVLTCLDDMLRGAVQTGVCSTKVPAAMYSAILRSLERYAKQLRASSAISSSTAFIGKALSLLEICSLILDEDNFTIEDEEYLKLGESLSVVMRCVADETGNIERGVLRAVVSLSNNKSDMCRLLGKTSIIETVFMVVDRDFETIADHAEHQQMLDQGRLDSVILALGCLLNFSECDESSRRRIAAGDVDSRPNVERLVELFNSQIAKAQEATTPEQGQILVAFGYLSMLLCTMSLDLGVRRQITQSLNGKSFQELCAAAGLFFGHLQTLENITEDDTSMTAFTARFGVILDTIRGGSES